MLNLRSLSQKNLIYTERGWGLYIKLTDPDGLDYVVSKDYGEPLKTLQTLTDFKKLNPESGEEITVVDPVVSIRLDALERVPRAGEQWFCKVQTTPLYADTSGLTLLEIIEAYPDYFTSFTFDGDRAPEGGSSIGFTRLYLHAVEQKII